MVTPPRDSLSSGAGTGSSGPGQPGDDGGGPIGGGRYADFLVAVGTSAGGLEALQRFFSGVRGDHRVAFLVIQHQSATHDSRLAEILERHSGLPFSTLGSKTSLVAGQAFVAPPGCLLQVCSAPDGAAEVVLEDSNATHVGHRYPIDRMLSTAAEVYGSQMCAVVLSGTGSDGSHGVRVVKEAGGLVAVQDDSAQFDGMPRSAIRTIAVDLVMTPERLAPRILEYADGIALDPEGSALSFPEPVEEILRDMQRRTGIEFPLYKPGTILRRVAKRAHLIGASNLQVYRERFLQDPDEADLLINELTVGVTGFFRDKVAFDALRTTGIPRLLQEVPEDRPIRVWVPGCSTGEEAYSLAIVLDETIQDIGSQHTFKIFATDVDSGAIAKAGEGIFDAGVEGVIPERTLATYFSLRDGRYRARQRIREKLVFAHHNVAKDPPFTRIDLVSCRNLLMFLQRPLQNRVMDHLCFALRPGGLMLLGKAETPDTEDDRFETLDVHAKLFCHIHRAGRRGRRRREEDRPQVVEGGQLPAGGERRLQARICSLLLSNPGRAAVVVDRVGSVVSLFGDTGRFLRLPEGDPTRMLMPMLEEGLRLAVSSLLRRIDRQTGRPETLHVAGVQAFDPIEQPIVVDLRAARVAWTGRREEDLFLVVFADGEQVEDSPATTPAPAPDELVRERITALEHELEETKEHLRATIEELEAANEELQSSNEELVAANQELQSTNEELHSVNEELHTVNSEHQARLMEQETLTNDMEHLLRTTDIGSIFLDEEGRVRKFTPAVQRVMPLLEGDIGRPVGDLRNSLLEIDLQQLATDVYGAAHVRELEARSELGSCLLVRGVPYRNLDDQLAGVVISFVDITPIYEARERLAQSESRFRQLAEHIQEVFWIRELDPPRFSYLSPAFPRLFGRTVDSCLQDPNGWFELLHPDDRERVDQARAEELVDGPTAVEYRIQLPEGGERWIRDRGFPIRNEAGQVVRICGVAADITDIKRDAERLRVAAESLDDLAHTDPLTGLANRRGLERILGQELARSRRSGARLVAILVDCDDFKSVNDEHGHAVGDYVLQAAARAMEGVLRPTDTVARIGGDEFLALLPETRLAEAFQVAERLRMAISSANTQVGDAAVGITASLGVCLVPSGAGSTEEVLVHAHGALRRSKREGKNRVAAPGSGPHVDPDELLESIVQGGLPLAVHAQGIYAVETGGLFATELLVRGPEGPYRLPQDLFRAAAQADQLVPLDLRCLETCVQAASLQSPSPEHRYHLNVYPATLVETPVERLLGLFESGHEPSNFCLEISEQWLLGEPDLLRVKLQELRNHGLQLALDDVGFGRSSLESLILLEPDVLKIDPAVLRGTEDERVRRRSLQRLVDVAGSLGAAVIAEGAETECDRSLLRQLGVPFAQGYLFDRPMLQTEGGADTPLASTNGEHVGATEGDVVGGVVHPLPRANPAGSEVRGPGSTGSESQRANEPQGNPDSKVVGPRPSEHRSD